MTKNQIGTFNLSCGHPNFVDFIRSASNETISFRVSSAILKHTKSDRSYFCEAEVDTFAKLHKITVSSFILQFQHSFSHFRPRFVTFPPTFFPIFPPFFAPRPFVSLFLSLFAVNRVRFTFFFEMSAMSFEKPDFGFFFCPLAFALAIAFAFSSFA